MQVNALYRFLKKIMQDHIHAKNFNNYSDYNLSIEYYNYSLYNYVEEYT